MKVTRFIIQACCGRTNVVFQIDRPIDQKLLDDLKAKGFSEWPQFAKSGLLYVDNLDFTLTGAFGSDKLQAKCKIKECDQKLNELEGLLLQME